MDNSFVRINKFISLCGYCSRRKADELIKSGHVKINNKIITDFSYKVSKNDLVEINGQIIKPLKHIYIVLNKPKDCICTVSDQKNRKTIFDYVKITNQGLFPVGRLDRNTTGTLLITNDGNLTYKLLHPSCKIIKTYIVKLDKKFDIKHFNLLKSGIKIDNDFIEIDDLFFPDIKIKDELIISIHSGKYHIIKRIFEKFNFKVKQLERISFAGITHTNLKRGEWRYLSKDEISYLYSL